MIAPVTTLIECDEHRVIGSYGRLLISIYRDRALEAHITSLPKQIQELQEGPIAMLTILESTSQVPDSGARRALPVVFRAIAERVTCSAVVTESTGFHSAVIRGITLGIERLASYPFPHKAYKATPEALVWIAAQTPLEVPHETIHRAVESLRSHLPPCRLH